MFKVDAVIVGAGACGLMCAVQAGYLGKKVLVFEKNDKIGAKILISGGGRCNYTNLFTSSENYLSTNPHFCKSALSRWTVEDTVQFFENSGIVGAEKTLGQLFPVGHKAKDIVNVFEQYCRDFDQDIYLNSEVVDFYKVDHSFIVTYAKNGKIHTLKSPKIVIATGGLSIPKMGATDFALFWAKKMGHQIVKTAPALVPLTITGKDEEWFSQLSGNAVFCSVSCKGQVFEENILFTHWGLSGPAVLQISSYWRRGEPIEIDFLPQQDILKLLQSQRKEKGAQTLGQFLHTYYSKKIVDFFGRVLPIQQNIASLTSEEMQKIKKYIHHFEVKPAGDKGYAKAEVMRGGIDTNELFSKTLESKIVKGLYFGGECVDVTGWLGGYNFQWAWASAYVIAQDL